MYRARKQRQSGSNFLQDRARSRAPKSHRPKVIGSVIVLVAIAVTTSLLLHIHSKNTPGNAGHIVSSSTGSSQHSTAQPTSVPNTDSFNMSEHSTTDPTSIWVIANKQHPLTPKTYAPKDLVVPNVPLRANITGDERLLRAEPAKALEKMVQAAASDGIHLNLQSGYRSYNFQVTLYNGYVAQMGKAAADRSSARPGFSEHQTGLAADLGGTTQPACDVAACYADTVEGKWLAAHADEYGFIVRYTSDKEQVTGYEYEPWHVRYVGTALAGQMHTTGVETLEEFFHVTGGTAY